ncbi:hypothetical protein AB205_0076030, partial [Aquarana catesbeiana]
EFNMTIVQPPGVLRVSFLEWEGVLCTGTPASVTTTMTRPARRQSCGWRSRHGEGSPIAHRTRGQLRRRREEAANRSRSPVDRQQHPAPPQGPPAVVQPTCAICLSEYAAEDSRTLPCNHGFHFACIHQWLQQHPTCPMCRAVIPPEDISKYEI